jgi:uncharacterized Zn finger protein
VSKTFSPSGQPIDDCPKCGARERLYPHTYRSKGWFREEAVIWRCECCGALVPMEPLDAPKYVTDSFTISAVNQSNTPERTPPHAE